MAKKKVQNKFQKKPKKDTEQEPEDEMEIDTTPPLEQRPEVVPDSDEEEELDTEKLLAVVSKKKSGGFQALGLSQSLLKGVMKKGYKQPTPIQRKAIPIIMEGRDVVAMARTGSGKTAAFLLPLFSKLKVHSAVTGARALIFSPTRELAVQTYKFCKDLGKFTDLQSVVILGGDALEDQFAAMHENPDIIIGTPGRLLHVIMEMNLKLHTMEYVVFDEADRLFEMGFQEQLTEVLNRLPDVRQTVLFSATLPRLLVDFAKAGLKDPALIRLDTESKLPDTLKTVFWTMRDEDKYSVLLYLLKSLPGEQLTVVFVPTKHHVEYLREILEKFEIVCSCVYSSLDQQARKLAVNNFKSKITKVMLVTDVAARGIDIPLLDNVINFCFPPKPKLFVHRVGRVARAGRFGTAYSFVSPDEAAFLLDLHLFLDRNLTFNDEGLPEDDSGVTGSVPQTTIDDERAYLDAVHRTNIDLENMKRVCSNAMLQYRKSRPPPSAESNKRMKALFKDTIPLHPLFKQDSLESARENMLDAFKRFKPTTTIFEIGNTGRNEASTVMRTKRKFHDSLIGKISSRDKDDLVHKTKGPAAAKSSLEEAGEDEIVKVFGEAPTKKQRRPATYKDDKFYIPHMASNHHFESGLGLEKNFSREAQSEVLDLLGEDNEDSRKKKNQMKWDRKKKRFVKEDDGNDPRKKMIKTESGALVPASFKKDLYKQWRTKNNLDVQDNHADDDAEEGDMFGKQRMYRRELGVNQRYQRTGRTEARDASGKRIVSELKKPEIILKEMKRKKKTQDQQKSAKRSREQGRKPGRTNKKKFKK